MKTIKTNVTNRELEDACRDNVYAPEMGDSSAVWVLCPDDYDAWWITAEDIMYDGRITVVDA